MTYAEMHKDVIGSGLYKSHMERLKRLASLCFARQEGLHKSKKLAAYEAIERYEDMTGEFYDPTEEELEEMMQECM